jgi:sortase A
MKKSISVSIIILGILLMLLPHIPNGVVRLKSKKTIEHMEGITAERLKENQGQEAEFDFNSVRDINITSTLAGSRKFDQNLIIGQLVIPDINLNLPVVKGLSESNLLSGAATMKKDQVMGEGNFSLAGHYMKRKDTLFGGLMDIKKGSIIKLTNKKNVYEYAVYETLIVPDTAVEMILDSKSKERGKPIISLMTCYYSSKTGKRFFALGELVKEYSYDSTFAQIVD